MTRQHTPDVTTIKPGPNGTIRRGTRITVKRVCDGCGESVGDITDAEIEAAINGWTLPSVSTEHGCPVETP